MGHEFSDTVIAVGWDVTHVRQGDLCTVMPLIYCGQCHECLRGHGHLCRTTACTGLSSVWGGLADLAIVSASYAEELGFDSIWLSEHHFSDEGYLPCLPAVLGALAASTTRARLGTAVLLAPLHHPLRLAEDLAVIDQLCGGRLDVGVAPGYMPGEFAAIGVPKSERGTRTDETLEILKLAWRGEPFSYAGRHFRFDVVTVLPPPVQQPGPPVWVGGSSLTSARRAARHGAGFMPDSGAGPEIYDTYRSGLSAGSGPARVATNRVCCSRPRAGRGPGSCAERACCTSSTCAGRADALIQQM
jgi:probable F420-dependent oxidoreductase